MITDTPIKRPGRVSKGRSSSLLQRIYSRLMEIEQDRTLQFFFLSGITLLALGMRLYKLGQWSFWVDEIFSIENSLVIFQKIAEQPLALHSITKVLIGIAVKLWGINEWSTRLAPALIGVISIPALYFPIRKMFGPATALISVLLLALSPWHLHWSQNARFYAAMLLFYCLALFLFYFGLQEQRLRYIVASLFFLLIATGERLSTLFLVPVILIYLFLIWILPYGKPAGLRLKNLTPLFVFLGLGIMFVLFDGYRYFSTGNSFLVEKFAWFFNTRVDDPVRLVLFTLNNIGLPLACLALAGGIFLVQERSQAGLYLTISILTPLILLAALTPFMFTQDRYVFFTYPCWTTLAAVAVQKIYSWSKDNGRILAAAVLLILVVDAMWGNILYFTANNGNRYDWRGAFALVNEGKLENDLFVSTYPKLGEYYTGEEMLQYTFESPTSIQQAGRRVWFVLDFNKSWANVDLKPWVEANARLIDVLYLRTPEYLNLRVYLYDPASNAVLSSSP